MHSVFVGFDARELVAYEVAVHSLRRHSSIPLDICPISRHTVPSSFLRPVEQRGNQLWCPISNAPMATDFAIARFVVPHLVRKGWALFVDCDVLFQADVAELFALADPQYAVMVVQHNHKPQETTKMDNQIQTVYPRKNWSSVILWNCEHPSNAKLSVEALCTWPGRDLHSFSWLADSEIGALSPTWNFLVDVYEPSDLPPKLLHYTLGGPWFDRPCGYANEWNTAYQLRTADLLKKG